MKDETLQIVAKLNDLSDVCATLAFATGEAVAEIDYKKYPRQVDVISGTVAVLDQLGQDLKSLSARTDMLTSKLASNAEKTVVPFEI